MNKSYKDNSKKFAYGRICFCFSKTMFMWIFCKKIESSTDEEKGNLGYSEDRGITTNVENGIRFHNWQNCTFAWHVQKRGSVGRDQYT